MPRPKARTLTKEELIYLDENYCKHGHTLWEHWNCYEAMKQKDGKMADIKERVGYLDIESSHLKATFGLVFCYCIKDGLGKKIFERTVTKKELFGKELDKGVIAQCCEDMRQFSRLVTWYGARFDIPFLRTRAEFHGIEFPKNKEIWHTDGWKICHDKMLLHSNRLNVVQEFFGGGSEKTKINPLIWLRAQQGHAPSLKYIRDHCIIDVVELQKVCEKILKYAPRRKTSI